MSCALPPEGCRDDGDGSDCSFSEGFEGPEKVLEVHVIENRSKPRGCRDIPKTEWQAVLQAAQATILHELSCPNMDAFVLSESSMFVYPWKVIIKTCGLTTLLRAVEVLLKVLSAAGLELATFRYSRKNFVYPKAQRSPHVTFEEEVAYCHEYFPRGHGYVLGPVTADHWLVFVDHFVTPDATDRDDYLNIMMFDLDRSFADLFIQSESGLSGPEMTIRSGLRTLVGAAVLQEHAFQPCGYSMNAVLDETYFTIHITPESHCSYASFETNSAAAPHPTLVKSVLNIFRPKRACVVSTYDHGSLPDIKDSLWRHKSLELTDSVYAQTASGMTDLGCERSAFLSNYTAKGPYRPGTHDTTERGSDGGSGEGETSSVAAHKD